MANVIKLDFTAKEINEKLGKIDSITPFIGTEADLNAREDIPESGQFVIYEPDETNTLYRIKLGDGVTSLNNFINIPFIGLDDSKYAINLSTADQLRIEDNKPIDPTRYEYFKTNFNRVYVERTKGRGAYGKYALTYSPTMLPEDYDLDSKGFILDSVPQRFGNQYGDDFAGHIKVPSVSIEDFENMTESARASAHEFAITKTYTDSAITRNNTRVVFPQIANEFKYCEGKCKDIIAYQGNVNGSEGLVYEISDDGTKAVCVREISSGGVKMIACEYQGVPVTEIAPDAFAGSSSTIYIPSTIRKIGARAFNTSSATIYINDLFTYMNIDFGNAWGTSPFTLNGSNIYIQNSNNGVVHIPVGITAVKTRTFQCNTSATAYIKELTFPKSLTKIENLAFGKIGVDHLIIPENVKSIEAAAFQYSTMTKITFEGTPDSLSETAFQECNDVTDIYVPWSKLDAINTYAPWGASSSVNIHYNGSAGDTIDADINFQLNLVNASSDYDIDSKGTITSYQMYRGDGYTFLEFNVADVTDNNAYFIGNPMNDEKLQVEINTLTSSFTLKSKYGGYTFEDNIQSILDYNGINPESLQENTLYDAPPYMNYGYVSPVYHCEYEGTVSIQVDDQIITNPTELVFNSNNSSYNLDTLPYSESMNIGYVDVYGGDEIMNNPSINYFISNADYYHVNSGVVRFIIENLRESGYYTKYNSENANLNADFTIKI